MKKLIMQVYYEGHSQRIQDGGYIPDYDLSVESEHRMKLYADSIGADYRMLREPYFKSVKNPGWNRFAMIQSEFDQYDEVCYVDADILVAKRALGVDIFTHPASHLDVEGKVWHELPDVDPSDVNGKVMEIGKFTNGEESWMINAGVLKLNKKERIKLRTDKWGIMAKPWIRDYLERTGKNQIAFNKSYKKVLRKKPGTMSPLWNSTRPWYEPAFFKHYIGPQKVKGQSPYGFMGDCPVYKEDWHNAT